MQPLQPLGGDHGKQLIRSRFGSSRDSSCALQWFVLLLPGSSPRGDVVVTSFAVSLVARYDASAITIGQAHQISRPEMVMAFGSFSDRRVSEMVVWQRKRATRANKSIVGISGQRRWKRSFARTPGAPGIKRLWQKPSSSNGKPLRLEGLLRPRNSCWGPRPRPPRGPF